MRQNPQRFSPGSRLGAILDAKFRKYIANVDLDRMRREIKLGRDFLISQSFGNESQYL
jgi:5,10-methylenetetrahydrofolate reductase